VLENKIVVVGGGHAGIEASLAASRLGVKCVMITMDFDAIGRLSCNPAVGGLAKSHLVKEIDALGGIMGLASDINALQYKTLNKTKGRAVWSTRVQVDKKKYPLYIQKKIYSDDNIDILKDEVVELGVTNNKISFVKTRKNEKILCSAVVVTCGTFLSGLIHIGEKTFKAGRLGEVGSYGLTENLIDLGFVSGRLKTGTPPRISKKSIDLGGVEVAPGDKEYKPFSLLAKKDKNLIQEDCFLVNTNKEVHDVIRKNFGSSAMFSGKIKGVGPRYCPSIEDKVNRFSDRPSHHLFLEPEWFGSDQIYVNGFSTSLSQKVQVQALKKIKALKNVELIRPGYAIEYDFFPPRQLKSSLESKNVPGLFFSGQINGTSGYEEAAAQGLIGGANAALYVLKKDPFVLSRNESYIGVMVDDLVTSHLDEPYRMFTSRAEHRLFLRPDNAYSRLFAFADSFNLLSKLQKSKISQYLDLLGDINRYIEKNKTKEKIPLSKIIKRPEERLINHIKDKPMSLRGFFHVAAFEAETTIKYAGYIENEKDRISKNAKLENLRIPINFNYNKVQGLSNESKERLLKIKPETLGQASRVFGVRPTDITIIGIYIGGLGVSRET